MPADNCVTHPDKYFLCIRKDYLKLFRGDHCCAALAAYFEFMTTCEMGRMDGAQETGEAWVTATMPAIHTDCLGLFSIRKLQIAIDRVEAAGIVRIKKEQYSPTMYLFNHDLVNTLLRNKNVIRGDSIGKFADQQSAETYEQYKEESLELRAENFSYICNGSLTTDVEHTIKYNVSDFCSAGSGSQTQSKGADVLNKKKYDIANEWPEQDKKTFKSRFTALKKAKLNGSMADEAFAWMAHEDQTIEDAMSAIAGYKAHLASTGESANIEDFTKRFYSYREAGGESAVKEEEPAPFVKIAPPVASSEKTTSLAPTPLLTPAAAILKWEQEVIPLSPPWNPRQDDKSHKLRTLCSTPDFVDNYDLICEKCAKILSVRPESKSWLSFRWLMGEKGGVANFWKVASGGLDSLLKSEKKMDAVERLMLKEMGE